MKQNIGGVSCSKEQRSRLHVRRVRARRLCLHEETLLPLSCTCVFVKNMRLPCRHVIAFRVHVIRCDHAVPIEMIDERYT
ncbi:TPA: hypothetical protein N0F65_004324 [Lagenidium giganteum]|uniref:SWIM-type domain-containing protein n=1 Tax=Lagenidium giganteum TaxID=4803 RepID=A0AAV2ZD48_9STRA|nr:TPA: hypothetical protein N0F65_004324 [Lagenidium giganteum]